MCQSTEFAERMASGGYIANQVSIGQILISVIVLFSLPFHAAEGSSELCIFPLETKSLKIILNKVILYSTGNIFNIL